MFLWSEKGFKRTVLFNSVLTSQKENLGNLFTFWESEKSLKMTLMFLFVKNDEIFPENPLSYTKTGILLKPVEDR